jgi:uncharacterized membrane protein SpoIIM required for sporulation/ABC-type transport system involved in multi-copper enzyme maturation permease subunit
MNKGWVEDFRITWLVAWRELRDQIRDWRIIFPMIILTLVLPLLANAGAKAAINFTTKYDTPLIAERLVPFLLLVVGFFPITVSLVIALEAFVGEKERGTIEPLLVSPLKNWHIYMGKLLAGTVAPLITSYLGIAVYLIGLAVQDIPFPDPNRLAQTLILTTAQGFLMVSGAILISTQSTSVRAANLMASFIVIPMAILIQGEAVMLFWGNDQILWLAVVGVTVLTILLARVGIAHFQREALLGREIDVLNLRWVGRVFWNSFTGGAKTLRDWYGKSIRDTLRRQAPATWLILVFGVISVVSGYLWMQSNRSLVPEDVFNQLPAVLPAGIDIPSLGGLTFSYIFGHNLQAVVIISLLGMVSFSTLGGLMYFLNTAVIGVVLALVGVMGLSPWKVAAFGILPHGVFELSALILSSGAVLQGGVNLVTPRSQQSLGEVLISAIGNWTRIFIGLVVPLLLIAAVIERWISPVLLANFGK